jgi:bifunctional DNase/RNase
MREIEVGPLVVNDEPEDGLIYFTVMESEESERTCAISISWVVAKAIEAVFTGAFGEHPYAFFLSLITALGARVEYAVIHDLIDGVLYAKLILAVNDTRIEVNSRPSDVFVLAALAEAPTYIEEEVLRKLDAKAPSPPTEKEIKILGPLLDSIEGLDKFGE